MRQNVIAEIVMWVNCEGKTGRINVFIFSFLLGFKLYLKFII
jgi:hypothetical protein